MTFSAIAAHHADGTTRQSTMKAVKTLADELSEADLAVFGIEDHEDMAPPAGIDVDRLQP